MASLPFTQGPECPYLLVFMTQTIFKKMFGITDEKAKREKLAVQNAAPAGVSYRQDLYSRQ